MAWDYFGKAGSTMGILNSGTTNDELNRKQQEALEPMLQRQVGRGGIVNNVANNMMMADRAAEIAARDRVENTIINDVPVFGDTPQREGTFALEMGRLADNSYDNVPPEAGVLSLTPPQGEENIPAQQVPDATQDPGGFIAATTANRAMGAGNMLGMPKMPEMPTPQETEAKAMDAQAKQVMFDQNKIPKWHESRAFSGGLLSFGLNLLSGNDLATSFGAAGKYFDEGYSREKREAWANDLVDAGYDAQDIQRWIETGNNDDLTDPMEKKMKMMQYQTAAQQLNNLQYESTPEMRQYRMRMEQMPLQMQMMQMQQAAAQHADNRAFRERELEAKQMKDAGYIYDPTKKGYVKAAASGTGKFSGELSKAENQYIRARQGMENYNRVVDEIGGVDKAYQQQGFLSDMADAAIIEAVFSGNQMTETAARNISPTTAKLITQEREFLAPLLRKDSGAAISQGEWKTTGEIYFPRPGDSAATRQRKSDSRVVATLAMNPMASQELKNALDMYTTGQLAGLKIHNKKVYAFDGRGWFEVPQ